MLCGFTGVWIVAHVCPCLSVTPWIRASLRRLLYVRAYDRRGKTEVRVVVSQGVEQAKAFATVRRAVGNDPAETLLAYLDATLYDVSSAQCKYLALT